MDFGVDSFTHLVILLFRYVCDMVFISRLSEETPIHNYDPGGYIYFHNFKIVYTLIVVRPILLQQKQTSPRSSQTSMAIINPIKARSTRLSHRICSFKPHKLRCCLKIPFPAHIIIINAKTPIHSTHSSLGLQNAHATHPKTKLEIRFTTPRCISLIHASTHPSSSKLTNNTLKPHSTQLQRRRRVPGRPRTSHSTKKDHNNRRNGKDAESMLSSC
ncbi:hypothetical protein BDD12DRAFT_358565 [Trichophaea hybrida]|nr:hypothetical protein BDD12DRAFT_358565 [Trichophaea hybrida]